MSVWPAKIEGRDFTFHAWAHLLQAHDPWPLEVVFHAGYYAGIEAAWQAQSKTREQEQEQELEKKEEAEGVKGL